MEFEAPVSQASVERGRSLKQSARVITAAPVDSQHAAFDRLIATLQEKNGWNRQRATKELLRRIRNRPVSPDKPG